MDGTNTKSKPNGSEIQDVKMGVLDRLQTDLIVEVKIHIGKVTKFEAILFWFSSLLTTFDGIQNVLTCYSFQCLLTVGKRQQPFFFFLNLLGQKLLNVIVN